MGLLNPVCEFLVQLHKEKPLGPKVLFISRQTVPLTEEALDRLLSRHGLENQNDGPVEFDEDTRGAAGQRYISDKYFMRALGVKDYAAIDVTAYEGADLVWDLGVPIPDEFKGKYDFIYNGGCFDNMFNPGVALMNLSAMLRPGGRMVCMESAASWNGPYVMFSPGWFNDFYVVNNYERSAVYLATYRDNDQLFHGPWRMDYINMGADPNGCPPEALNGDRILILTWAEKGESSTDHVQPVQYQYRTTQELRTTFKRLDAGLRSRAPLMIDGRPIPPVTAPYLNPVGELGVDLR